MSLAESVLDVEPTDGAARARWSTPGRRPASRTTAALRRFLSGLAFVAGLAGLWQAWVSLANVDTIVAPGPNLVLRDILGNPTLYLGAAGQTLRTAALGLLLGTTAGSLVAALTWWSPLAGAFVAPVMAFGRLVPVVVVIPVVARMVGYDVRAVVAATALMTFSFSYVLVGAGLRSAPPTLGDVVAVYGGRRGEQLRRVAIPVAVPALASAVRMGATSAVLGALAAEFLIGTDGLGALFVQSRLDYAHVARSWGVAVVASALSALLFLSTTHLEKLARRRFG